MILFFPSNNLGDPLDDLISGLEEWCIAFNEFAVQFFGYLKNIFVFILLAIGISTLLKLRGHYTGLHSFYNFTWTNAEYFFINDPLMHSIFISIPHFL